MGLFDKKKDDFGSPVERIDLSAPSPGTQGQKTQSPAKSTQSTAPVRGIPQLDGPPEPVTAGTTAASAPSNSARYGIAQAIELMRTLPGENVELVIQVVKKTLESTHIRIETIIQDATRKQGEIEGRVAILRQEIAELEGEVATRRAEITRLEADHRETTLVKDRLVLAERLNTPAAAAPGPSVASAAAPAPILLDKPVAPRLSGAHAAVSGPLGSGAAAGAGYGPSGTPPMGIPGASIRSDEPPIRPAGAVPAGATLRPLSGGPLKK